MKQRTSIGHYVLILILLIIFFVPILWIFLTSIKTSGEIYAWPPVFIPSSPTLDNYATVLFQSNLGLYILNSLLICTVSTILVVLLASLAGYGITRVAFKGSGIFFIFFLSMSMFPQLSIAPSIFLWFSKLGLLNRFSGLIIAYLGLFMPLAIWILSTYMKTIPEDIEDSARIDGCSVFRIIFQILFPLAIPGVIAASLIMFIFSWNEFFLSLIILSKDTLRTATVGIALYPGEYAFPWELISTATFLAIIPLALLLFFFQQRIISGLTAGALKS